MSLTISPNNLTGIKAPLQGPSGVSAPVLAGRTASAGDHVQFSGRRGAASQPKFGLLPLLAAGCVSPVALLALVALIAAVHEGSKTSQTPHKRDTEPLVPPTVSVTRKTTSVPVSSLSFAWTGPDGKQHTFETADPDEAEAVLKAFTQNGYQIETAEEISASQAKA